MYTPTSQKLRDHLEKEHHQSPFADYLREIVYGGIDGIVTTFAVVAGFSGATIMGSENVSLSFLTVLLFGLANLFADASSMGLGNFLAIKTEKDLYREHKNKERNEVENHPQDEIEETLVILQDKGFSKEQASQMTNILQTNKEYWVDWMMNHELELPNPENVNPYLTAFSTFISFIIFGFIPLVPYLFSLQTPSDTFLTSITGTVLALVLLGFLKGRVIEGRLGWKILKSIFEVLIIGSISAIIAFLVGSFFAG